AVLERILGVVERYRGRAYSRRRRLPSPCPYSRDLHVEARIPGWHVLRDGYCSRFVSPLDNVLNFLGPDPVSLRGRDRQALAILGNMLGVQQAGRGVQGQRGGDSPRHVLLPAGLEEILRDPEPGKDKVARAGLRGLELLPRQPGEMVQRLRIVIRHAVQAETQR